MGLNHFFCAGLIMDYGRMVSVFEHFLGYMILKNHWGVVVWARLIEIFFVKLICFYEVFWGFLIQSSYFCQDFHVFFISIFYQSMCLAFFVLMVTISQYQLHMLLYYHLVLFAAVISQNQHNYFLTNLAEVK